MEEPRERQGRRVAVLESMGAVVADVADVAGPAVVSIGRDGRGSGFVVGQDRVVTERAQPA